MLRLEQWDGANDGWKASLPLREWPEVAEILIDASALRFAVPPFLLRLQTFIDWHRANGRKVRLISPTSHAVASYLSRMRVDYAHRRGMFGLPTVKEHDRSEVLIPITRLHDLPDVELLNAELAPLFQAHLDDVARLAGAMHMAISELCGNAVEHGASDHGCYVTAQRYERGTGGKRMVLAIADLGIGIPAHLRGVEPALRSDHLAIARATEEGVSGTGKSERGYGFYWVMQEAQGTALRYARLEIRSGRGQVTSALTGRGRLESSSPAPNKRGTWITFVLGAP